MSWKRHIRRIASSGEEPESLVHKLRQQGIADPAVLNAIAEVPRELFVPESERVDAWSNVALPIGQGQTISQPYVVAAMTEALQLTGTERVLEVGTGSGYQAAILSRLARSIVSVERIPELASNAKKVLEEIGCDNVEVVVADGSRGWPELAPYQGIIVAAAAPSVSAALRDQMDPNGGRLVAPIGTTGMEQRLVLIERSGSSYSEIDLGGVAFVPLIRDQTPDRGSRTRNDALEKGMEKSDMTPTLSVGHVHLKVSDLERSIAFYERAFGLELQQRFGSQAAFLSADGYHHHIGLNTWESLDGSPPPFGSTGLYHFALLYPDRPALARAYQRLLDNNVEIDGAADHGVSEAIYLHDPDHNGIEIYRDRPKELWPRTEDGKIAMVNAHLDLDALLDEVR